MRLRVAERQGGRGLISSSTTEWEESLVLAAASPGISLLRLVATSISWFLIEAWTDELFCIHRLTFITKSAVNLVQNI